MVKKCVKYLTFFSMLLIILLPMNIFAETTDSITFARKYVNKNKLFTITFNKELTCQSGVQTIQDIDKLITCTDDVTKKSIPIRASYQVNKDSKTTKLNIQISSENGQPSGELGRDYTLTINKGIKATDGTATDKTYYQPFTINAPEPVDDNVRLMISKDQYVTHAKGYEGNDWLMTYPYCSQVLLNDGTMLKNVPIKYSNGHVSGDAIEESDVADGGVSTILSKEGTYVYNGYPIINGVEDNKRLFTFTFVISNKACIQHIDSKIIVGSSYLSSILTIQPTVVNVFLTNNSYQNSYVYWNNPSMDDNGRIFQDNTIYENNGYVSNGNIYPFIYYYVANPPNDDAEFTKATKNLSEEQINYLKDIQSIIGNSHWDYDKTSYLSLYKNDINKDGLYDYLDISFGRFYIDEKTNKPYSYLVNMNNVLGNVSFSDFQKIKEDALGLLGKDTMAPITSNISELDAEIQSSLYPLNNLTNTMLKNKKYSGIFEYQKQINGITIKASANTANGKIESQYYLNNGK